MKTRVIGIVASLLVVASLAWLASHMSFENMHDADAAEGRGAHNPFYAAHRSASSSAREAELGARVHGAADADSVIVLSNWNWNLSRARRERIERGSRPAAGWSSTAR